MDVDESLGDIKMQSVGCFTNQVTPIILTYNEEGNISRVLSKLRWAREVVVVDSGSTDKTLELLSQYGNVRCVNRTFDNHARQWNFAISETAIKTDWVLALDADYVLSDELVDEIAKLIPPDEIVGYETSFHYCVFGKPLRGTLYPPAITLFRRAFANYKQDGHTQRIQLDGKFRRLHGLINHDDRKPLINWLWAQSRYAKLEADALLNANWSELTIQDRLRRMIVITPWLVPLYCLTVGRGLLDGWAGIYYALQRGIAEAVLSLKLVEMKFNARTSCH